jgi:hypothetical protein
MEQTELRELARKNRATYELLQILAPLYTTRKKPARPSAELAEPTVAGLKQYVEARSSEADRLFEQWENPLLSATEREQISTRLDELSGELRRADVAQRKLDRNHG